MYVGNIAIYVCCKINPVLVDMWIQSTSTNKLPHEVKDYVSDAVGLWVSDTLKCSDKVW